MYRLIAYALASIILILAVIFAGLWSMVALRETQTLTDARPSNGMVIPTPLGEMFITPTGQDTNPPVLLIHGTGSWGGYWQETANNLSQNNYLALAVDVPPFGYSQRSADGDYTRGKQAARILAMMDEMANKPIVVAHSFGASVALETVMLAPEKFAGLVIVSGAVGVNSHKTGATSLPFPTNIDFIRQTATAATSTNPFLTEYFIDSFLYENERDLSKYAEILRRPTRLRGTTSAHADWIPSLLVAPKDAISTRPDKIAEFPLKTALIWGDKDKVSPPENAFELQNLIPSATLDMMVDVGHIPQIEQPEAFHTLLLSALSRISGGTE